MATALPIDDSSLLLPDNTSSVGNGPVSKAHLRRTACVYVLLCLLGLAPGYLGLPPALQAAGLGLWFPGAGFIALGGWWSLLTPLTLILFAVAFFFWFATGNVLAPLFVWIAAALGAALLADTPAWAYAPHVVAGFVVVVFFVQKQRNQTAWKKALDTRNQRNAYLPAATSAIAARAVAAPTPAERELSVEEMASVRYLLDRALQPLDTFEGFDVIEQFQPAALRYQLNHMQYTLALAHCQYTPSFHGYLSLAQRNLIDKLTQPKVWGYWRLESLWGHLSLDFDPAGKDNIMLTGWSSICLNTYTANTGDTHYGTKGCLDFALAGKSYKHDAHSFAQSLLSNFSASAFCLYPCEPNWIYPVCNIYGITGLAAYDRAFGSHHVAGMRQDFLNNLHAEFMRPDGVITALRSQWTGIGIPVLNGVLNYIPLGSMAGAVFPTLARRAWAIVRNEFISFDASGKIEIKATRDDMLDLGNYKMTGAYLYATMAQMAREHGDEQVALALLAKLDDELGKSVEGGVLRLTKASNLTNAIAVQARISRQGDWHNTVMQGPPKEVLAGPILEEAVYPAVLVARAFSNGDDLDLVLHPGSDTGPQTIGIARLKPSSRYRLVGDDRELVADAQGKLKLTVVLDGRTPVHLVPR